tara:strand:- start:170 stop:1549 length:1380 start_codon:yes stop_codon:yes gene_type:complete
MKFLFIIFLIFFSNNILANDFEDKDIEVINLYESKSLDQMVLEKLNDENETETVNEDLNFNNEIENNNIDEVQQIEIVKDSFIYKMKIKDIKNYFNNLQRINSKTLQMQIIEVLGNIQLNLDIEKDKEIFFLIVNYLQSIGQINKSYELIQRYELNEDINYNYFTEVKLNYLLSTFQLNEACNLREELNLELNYFYLEKLDIFCLILNNNDSQANLLNSILIESENNEDNYFQYLFSLISDSSDQLNINKEIKIFEINKDLIFLYSAMIRIAELPFSHEFYELDKKNLSIPIILNQASPIDLRIKAANESFLENLIKIDSLSALYMSADFNSDQLNNPIETLDSFSDNKHLSMAFLYQLVNIQIFPNDRLSALIQFWNFAKRNNLDEIAYKLSINMLSSIEVSTENIVYGTQIASAYIFNNDFESAIKWIELYESSNEVDSKSISRIINLIYNFICLQR